MKISIYTLVFISLSVIISSCSGLTRDSPDKIININPNDREKFVSKYTNYENIRFSTVKKTIKHDEYEEHAVILRGGGVQIVIREPFVRGEFVVSCYRDRYGFSVPEKSASIFVCNSVVRDLVQST